MRSVSAASVAADLKQKKTKSFGYPMKISIVDFKG